jgi:hypothetical protein
MNVNFINQLPLINYLYLIKSSKTIFNYIFFYNLLIYFLNIQSHIYIYYFYYLSFIISTLSPHLLPLLLISTFIYNHYIILSYASYSYLRK